MKKLQLNLDTLSVDSFPTQQPHDDAAGTVHGNMATRLASCFTSCRGDLRDGCTCPVGTA